MEKQSNFTAFWADITRYATEQKISLEDSQDALQRHLTSTTGVQIAPQAKVYPTKTSHIEQIVKLANQHLISLHPISTGKNWGYSDASPTTDNSVIVDLSNMNQILKIDEEHQFAIIEPGVTQEMLSKALQNTSLFMDCTGSTKDSSLVGNILERGFGHTTKGDRFGHSCSYEVVLGNGSVLRTGHLAYNDLSSHTPQTCHTSRTTGPIVDGLFSQSNYGIVTKLCIWLSTKPESILPYLILYESHDDFLNAIKPLSELKSLGVTRSIMHVGNDLRALSSSIKFDPKKANDKNLLPDEEIQKQLSQLGIGPWIMSGALYGSKAMVKLYKKELRGRLLGVSKAKILFMEPNVVNMIAKILNKFPEQSFSAFRTKIVSAQALIDMHSGVPTNYFLKGCYHKHANGYPVSMESDIDVAKDGCGLIWLSPTAPANKDSVENLLTLLKASFEKYGFHLYATLSFIDERSLAIICNPIFDINDQSQIDLVHKCTKEALQLCIEQGFPPYRVANAHWQTVYNALSDEHRYLLKAVKKHLDPNNIISPGRYGME